MNLKPIKSLTEYNDVLNWLDEQFEAKVQINSAEGDKLQIALLLIKQYEDENYSIPSPDPIETIKLIMEERGLKNKDFVGKIGSKGYISALLNKKKPLTIDLARFFHRELGIPASILLS